jgi:hypothetical protein
MTRFAQSRQLVALVALGAVLSLMAPQPASAFTLIETQFLPAVQLGASQQVQVSASNFSNASVSITINILNSTGTIVATKTATLSSNGNSTLRFTNGNSAAVLSAMVEASAASSIASDFQVLSSNGEAVAAILPYVQVPAVQYTGGIRLIAGQSGGVAVTNISTGSQEITVTVYNNNGNMVLNQTSQVSAGHTWFNPFSNTGTGNNGYRAVVSTANSNTAVASLMTFDKTTGLLVAVLWPPDPCTC